MTALSESGPDSFSEADLWWPIRAANVAGRVGQGVLRRPLYGLQPEALLAEAVQSTGLTDLGPSWPDAHFRTLLDSLEHEARLTPIGRRFAHRQVLRDLQTRLGIVRALRDHPDVGDRPIRRPIFMVNLPRCGSTLLQFLLARAPEVRSLWPWEIADPAATGEPTAAGVQARTKRHYRLVNRMLPTYRDIHPMQENEPEECTPLLARSFVALDLASIYDVPSYTDFVTISDLRPAYREFRAQIQLIQGGDTEQTWVLRTPAHLFATRAILEVFPDAVVVQLHRDPLTALTSFCSLAATLRRANSYPADPRSIGPRWMERWAAALDDSLAARHDAPATATFVDIDYRDLVSNPLETVDCVRRAVTSDPAPLDAGAVLARVNAGHRGQPHRYEPEWFGLERAAVTERFAEYTRRFALNTTPESTTA